MPVGVVERRGHLGGDPHGVGHGQLFLPGEPVAQRFTGHEGHDVEEEGVRLAGIEKGEDVRVLEVGRELDLGEEPLGPDDR